MENKIDRFSPPAQFEEVDVPGSVSVLGLQDVCKSGKELWLIRAPSNFNGTLLDGVRLSVDERKVPFSKEKGEKLQNYEAITIRNLQENVAGSPYLLLPSGDGNSLEPAPAFQGQITIMESLEHPAANQTPDVKVNSAPKLPTGLKQRFMPFGCGEPKRLTEIDVSGVPGKQKKKVKTKAKEGDLVTESVSISISEKMTGLKNDIPSENIEAKIKVEKKAKKMKRKQAHAKTQETVAEPGVVEEEQDLYSPKKKKKKKKEKKD